jgi:hypothetical protein
MKKTLLFLSLTFLTSIFLEAQIVAGQTDDFQDTTVQGWRHQVSNANEPVNLADDGPAGVGDYFLRNSNSGVNGSGGRHIMFNQESRWTGDFTSQGIVAIRMNVRNSGPADLHLRLAFRGGPGNTWIASTNSTVVPAVLSAWSVVYLSTNSADFTVSQGTDTALDVLQDVSNFRILSNDGNDMSAQAALHKGDLRVQVSDYDNITASTTLTTSNFESSKEFRMYPNPSGSNLNIKLPQTSTNAVMEVFDVLGKRIHVQDLNRAATTVNVSAWNSGVYLVKITSENSTQTKRFVKQ